MLRLVVFNCSFVSSSLFNNRRDYLLFPFFGACPLPLPRGGLHAGGPFARKTMVSLCFLPFLFLIRLADASYDSQVL